MSCAVSYLCHAIVNNFEQVCFSPSMNLCYHNESYKSFVRVCVRVHGIVFSLHFIVYQLFRILFHFVFVFRSFYAK